jgi:anti-sigma factor ChrR (cupin superfamily)
MDGLALALDELRALALSPKLVWRHFVTGVQIHRLWGAPHTRSGALLRYSPGSKVPRHRHEGVENIYVLIGSQRDERGVYPAGSHVVNQPGSSHAVSSPEGCVVFVVWERPNTFLDTEKA